MVPFVMPRGGDGNRAGRWVFVSAENWTSRERRLFAAAALRSALTRMLFRGAIGPLLVNAWGGSEIR